MTMFWESRQRSVKHWVLGEGLVNAINFTTLYKFLNNGKTIHLVPCDLIFNTTLYCVQSLKMCQDRVDQNTSKPVQTPIPEMRQLFCQTKKKITLISEFQRQQPKYGTVAGEYGSRLIWAQVSNLGGEIISFLFMK